MNRRRLVLSLLAASVLIGTSVPVVFWHLHAHGPPSNTTALSTANIHPSVQNTIRGFHYNGTVDGQPVLSIRADQFSLQKKKLGFFRFGLMQEAVLDNAEIQIYQQMNSFHPADRSASQTVSTAAGPPIKKQSERSYQQGALPNIFKDSVMSLFHGKRVSAITAHPVRLIFGSGPTATVITALEGNIRVAKRDILLEGRVVVTAQDRVLRTDRLVIKPERWLLMTEGQYALQTPGGNRSGRRLISNLQLLPAGMSSSIGPRVSAGQYFGRGEKP